MIAVPGSNGKVLFITSMPASRSNAIGIQILNIAKPFESAWGHCYWDTGMGVSEVPNSHCLNSSIPRLWPSAIGRGFLARSIERFGLGWWRGDRLLESSKSRLRNLFQDVRFAYVAPLRNSEATKCREILETVRCPFVIHIWDILDASLNADYAWLFSRAERVFYLSENMVREIEGSAPCETSSLPFVRPQSKCRARHSGSAQLAIGLIGYLSSYQDGLELLSQAINGLLEAYSNVLVKYLGPPGQLNYIPKNLKRFTENVGFPDDDARDKALASCNVAFLPGPLRAPDQDLRSRYSIPSRMADYLAVGLPVIAAANINSATSIFFSSLQGHGFFPVSNPEDILRATGELKAEEAWANATQECLAFFDTHCDNQRALGEFCRVARQFL